MLRDYNHLSDSVRLVCCVVLVCIWQIYIVTTTMMTMNIKHKRKTNGVGVSLFARVLTKCWNSKNK